MIYEQHRTTAITMEILSEIGRTKIIVRRADLAKSALIRAAACSRRFLSLSFLF